MLEVPFCRPTIGREEKRAVMKCLDSGWLTAGRVTEQFQEDVKKYLGCRFAYAVNSCTSALFLASKMINLKHGDEVVTTSFTFASTTNAIVQCGATPVYVDIDPKTYNIDMNKIEEAITPRTKAIIPVHYAGLPCDMIELSTIAGMHGLFVIEDAAHAIGSEYTSKDYGTFKIGSAPEPLPFISCFSLFPTKTITNGGDGGILTWNDAIFDEQYLKKMIALGRVPKGCSYSVEELGYKTNTTDVNSSIAIEQLKKIDKFIDRRRKIARMYNRGFKNIHDLLQLPTETLNTKHSFYIYPILLKNVKNKMNRDMLMAILKEQGIQTSIHFPALHLQPYMKRIGLDYNRGDFPITEYTSENILSLPMYPTLKNEQVKYVIEAINEILK